MAPCPRVLLCRGYAWAKLRSAEQIMIAVTGNFAHPTLARLLKL
jgi:hypothetical protein